MFTIPHSSLTLKLIIALSHLTSVWLVLPVLIIQSQNFCHLSHSQYMWGHQVFYQIQSSQRSLSQHLLTCPNLARDPYSGNAVYHSENVIFLVFEWSASFILWSPCKSENVLASYFIAYHISKYVQSSKISHECALLWLYFHPLCWAFLVWNTSFSSGTFLELFSWYFPWILDLLH